MGAAMLTRNCDGEHRRLSEEEDEGLLIQVRNREAREERPLTDRLAKPHCLMRYGGMIRPENESSPLSHAATASSDQPPAKGDGQPDALECPSTRTPSASPAGWCACGTRTTWIYELSSTSYKFKVSPDVSTSKAVH